MKNKLKLIKKYDTILIDLIAKKDFYVQDYILHEEYKDKIRLIRMFINDIKKLK